MSIETSSTATRSPFRTRHGFARPTRRRLNAAKIGAGLRMSGATLPVLRRAKRCRPGPGCRRSRGSVGWVGGVYPSAPLTARTAASDGHCAFTRAARSAGLNFAVILLSKAMDVGRDHLIHRKRSPFPYEGKAYTRSLIGAYLHISSAINSTLHSPLFTLSFHPAQTIEEYSLMQKAP